MISLRNPFDKTGGELTLIDEGYSVEKQNVKGGNRKKDGEGVESI
ncbi:hypothetical protein J2S13_002393 [Oikeobacillus pervagus]|uniref:Uncharacterized protein n=1 Tax=Oikeobacillus pervagus TaxID=1325931 RepID=A0AAJ1WL99_9BACI|nr:hypothetical protein [Oikeobacillus pervagus]MDQ0215971.1 hypothetical protein [Oikeobacillus pervagus]